MAGLCSRHRDKREGCVQCAVTREEFLEVFGEKIAEAEAAGKHTCDGWNKTWDKPCTFTYYKTTQHCPLCGKKREEDGNK